MTCSERLKLQVFEKPDLRLRIDLARCEKGSNIAQERTTNASQSKKQKSIVVVVGVLETLWRNWRQFQRLETLVSSEIFHNFILILNLRGSKSQRRKCKTLVLCSTIVLSYVAVIDGYRGLTNVTSILPLQCRIEQADNELWPRTGASLTDRMLCSRKAARFDHYRNHHTSLINIPSCSHVHGKYIKKHSTQLVTCHVQTEKHSQVSQLARESIK